MTVIVAVRDTEQNNVVVAADRLSLDENDTKRYASKLWVDDQTNDRIVIGLAGVHSALSICRHTLVLPDLVTWESEGTEDSWAQYVAELICERAVMRNITDPDGVVEMTGILAVRDRLWLIGHFFAEPMPDELAGGAGADAAYGALYAMGRKGSTVLEYAPDPDSPVPAEQKARTAACAARATKPGVGGQIDLERTIPLS